MKQYKMKSLVRVPTVHHYLSPIPSTDTIIQAHHLLQVHNLILAVMNRYTQRRGKLARVHYLGYCSFNEHTFIIMATQQQYIPASSACTTYQALCTTHPTGRQTHCVQGTHNRWYFNCFETMNSHCCHDNGPSFSFD